MNILDRQNSLKVIRGKVDVKNSIQGLGVLVNVLIVFMINYIKYIHEQDFKNYNEMFNKNRYF